MKSPRLRQTVFRLKISSFLAFSTFEKGFLWHSRWGGGVTRANFCITRGSLSWLVAPRDAKIGTRDTTPSPLVPQKALFKGLEGQKDWFSAEKQFALPQTFHVVLTNIIKYYFFPVRDDPPLIQSTYTSRQWCHCYAMQDQQDQQLWMTSNAS